MKNQNPTTPTDTATLRGFYDVIVVGARAAGAATAMLLARRGLRVLAVDRAAYGSDTLSTHCIALAGVHLLSEWGVLDRLRESGTPPGRTVVFNYGDEPTKVDIEPRGDVDGLYSPRRTLLDAALVDAAVESGAHVRHGVSLLGVTRNADGRVDGAVLDVDGQRRRVPARWVVGADGARSKVASLVEAPYTHRDERGAASIYTYWRGLPPDVIVNHYEPGRGGGVIPTNDGLAVVWTALTPERFREEARGNLAAVHHQAISELPGLADSLRGSEQVERPRGFPGVPGFLRRPVGPGWALVGDAGYFKDPVSAHGITDAFIGAHLLSEALAEEHRTGSGSLDQYAVERDRLAAQMMPPVAAVARLDQDLDTVKDAFRAMSKAMRDEYAYLLDRSPVAA